ncbi:hypothetical protein [Parasediminibacterium sp. JCM 36343]|uniref:hypothetical protein n=1 Tax=Parasediminibacterium sp. JCM 36343 TaxID=3374279 RepID=UPI00397AF28E
MRRFLAALLFTVAFTNCKPPVYTYVYKTLPPEIQIHDTSKGIVLIDATPTTGDNNNANNNYSQYLFAAMQEDVKLPVETASDVCKEEMQLLLAKNPTVTSKIMKQYNANMLVVITKEEVGFKLDKIDKVKYENGAVSKTAMFDVFFEAKALIAQDNTFLERTIYVSRYYASRNVIDGVQTLPPEMKGCGADINMMAKENAQKLAHLFLDKKVIETWLNNKRHFKEVNE